MDVSFLERSSSFISKCQLNSNIIKYISMNKTLWVARWMSVQSVFGSLSLIISSLEQYSNSLSLLPHTHSCLPSSVVVSGPKQFHSTFRVWSSVSDTTARHGPSACYILNFRTYNDRKVHKRTNKLLLTPVSSGGGIDQIKMEMP